MQKKNMQSEKKFDFNDTAKQMAALKAAIFNVTDTNDHKIQFIKDELSAGRYQTQSELIAARMLEYTRTTTPEVEMELA